MKRYDKYKDSGVEWLGEIPEHWDLVKIKYLFDFITGFTPPTTKEEYYNGDLDWVTIADLTSKYVSSSKTRISQTAITDMCKKPIPQGSLMYSFKLSVGKVAFAAKELFTNEAIFSVLPDKTLNLNYYYYALQDILIHNANENIYGAKLLNQELILNSLLPKLSNCEQQKIAEYLDYTVGKIDVMIQSKEAQIERLQSYRKSMINEIVTKGLDPNVAMKDSGVEWLGEIPEHWISIKLKFLGDYHTGLTYSPTDITDENDGTLVLRSSNIQENKLALKDKVFVKCNIQDYLMVKKGDIIICSRNGSPSLVGKAALIEEDIVATFGAFMMIFKGYDGIDNKYLYYVLTQSVQNYKGLFTTSTINQLTNTVISEIFVPFTQSNKEQESIVSYIEQRTRKIDCIASELNQQIEKLKEYKTAIISEAVTGKIDLRDWVHP